MEQRQHLGHEIKTVSNLIKRRISNTSIFAAFDRLTGMHGWFIGFIYHRNVVWINTFQRDMEAEFSIRRSTATRILQLMEKRSDYQRNCGL